MSGAIKYAPPRPQSADRVPPPDPPLTRNNEGRLTTAALALPRTYDDPPGGPVNCTPIDPDAPFGVARHNAVVGHAAGSGRLLYLGSSRIHPKLAPEPILQRSEFLHLDDLADGRAAPDAGLRLPRDDQRRRRLGRQHPRARPDQSPQLSGTPARPSGTPPSPMEPPASCSTRPGWRARLGAADRLRERDRRDLPLVPGGARPREPAPALAADLRVGPVPFRVGRSAMRWRRCWRRGRVGDWAEAAVGTAGSPDGQSVRAGRCTSRTPTRSRSPTPTPSTRNCSPARVGRVHRRGARGLGGQARVPRRRPGLGPRLRPRRHGGRARCLRRRRAAALPAGRVARRRWRCCSR